MNALRELPVLAAATFASAGRRPAQEDHSLILTDKRIFAIADGFGGPLPGAQAARTACEAVKSFLYREAGDIEATLPFVMRKYFSLTGNVLFNAVIHANREVAKRVNRGKSIHERGGTSLLAGYMDGDLLAVANVGACSAWLMRGGSARELVTPRTYARLRDPFGREADEGFQIPLTAVGIWEDLEPEIFEYRILPGDWLFLQTDGISAAAREAILTLQGESLLSGSSADGASREALRILEGQEYSENATAGLVIF